MEDIEIEEGEISDSSDTTYTPLERPANYSQILTTTRFPVILPESESDEIESSDSDSDSDAKEHKSKKPRLRKLPRQKPQQPAKKKYDIWSTRVQEDVLAETLNSCDVTIKDRSRDVESYDFTIGARYYAELEEKERSSNKRTRDDRKNVNFRQKKRCNSNERKKSDKGDSRKILSLIVSAEDNIEQIAKDIANKLFEEKEDLILKVIETMGKQKAISIFQETQKIESEGGMLIKNETRRRTPGGVYLYLVRNDYHITPDQKKVIFGDERKQLKEKVKLEKTLKSNRLKLQIAESKNRNKLLPELLTRAELLAKQDNRTRKEADESDDVINPPPTPETDFPDNSGDGMENIALNGNDSLDIREKPNAYDDDFLDIGCSTDMDLF